MSQDSEGAAAAAPIDFEFWLNFSLKNIQMLVDANSAASIQPLEDSIRLNLKDMDKLAKGLDKLDLRYEQALGYWESARNSDNRARTSAGPRS